VLYRKSIWEEGTNKGDDIVYSIWKHIAGYNPGQSIANFAEYKGYEIRANGRPIRATWRERW